jgi:D-alanyl-D-alanine carboxypeptidase (penicillin-binding protein 5/6)
VTDGPGATRPVPIASVAKLMTAYVILQDHPLSANGSGPDITVEPSEAAEYPSQVADGDSLVAVAAGEMLTERQALEALLLPSADNMAWILARWDAGSQAAFAARMNATARRLGMTGTSYTDPSGLDPSTTSTAADQVRLGMAAMQVPALAAITAKSTALVPVADAVRNTNTLLGHDGIVGLKTGSTQAAGGCLLVAAWQEVNGHNTLIVAATFGQPGTAGTILPNALRAGHNLVLALNTALDPGAQPGSPDNSEGPPQGPGRTGGEQKARPCSASPAERGLADRDPRCPARVRNLPSAGNAPPAVQACQTRPEQQLLVLMTTHETGDNDDAGGHAGDWTGRRQPLGYRPRDLARGHPQGDPDRLSAGAMEARPGARGTGAAPGRGHAAAR